MGRKRMRRTGKTVWAHSSFHSPKESHSLDRGSRIGNPVPIILPREAMSPIRQDPGDLLQGTLGILILKSLLLGAAHGYAIARWVEETTGDVLKIEEGSLYPA